jgi:hypothetical protein
VVAEKQSGQKIEARKSARAKVINLMLHKTVDAVRGGGERRKTERHAAARRRTVKKAGGSSRQQKVG